MYILFYNKTKNPATRAGLFLGTLSSEQAVLFHEDEKNRDNDQCEDCRCQQAADDDDGHTGPRFRPGRHGQGRRQHADDHGQGGHEDRTQPDAPGLDDGAARVQALFVHEGQRIVQCQ